MMKRLMDVHRRVNDSITVARRQTKSRKCGREVITGDPVGSFEIHSVGKFLTYLEERGICSQKNMK
jgi:hypothetical protein